jgi:hypothetical protein
MHRHHREMPVPQAQQDKPQIIPARTAATRSAQELLKTKCVGPPQCGSKNPQREGPSRRKGQTNMQTLTRDGHSTCRTPTLRRQGVGPKSRQEAPCDSQPLPGCLTSHSRDRPWCVTMASKLQESRKPDTEDRVPSPGFLWGRRSLHLSSQVMLMRMAGCLAEDLVRIRECETSCQDSACPVACSIRCPNPPWGQGHPHPWLHHRPRPLQNAFPAPIRTKAFMNASNIVAVLCGHCA